MYDRILVPLDGSPMSERVLCYATRISLGLSIPIHLMQVCDSVPETMSDPARGRYVSNITQGRLDHATDYLNDIKRKMPVKEITCAPYEGDAASVISREASKTPNSLIAIATHGRSGLTRWLLGSVVDTVLHRTKNPMLIVRSHGNDKSEPEMNLETIIAPVDGSPLSEEVLPHVASLAYALNLKVTLLEAVATVEELSAMTGYQRLEGVGGLHFPSSEKRARDASNQAVEYIKGLENDLKDRGVANIDHIVKRGPASNVIVDTASETPGSLVAMTTHGRSGPSRWALGSVTDCVVRHSGDPVLVIRTGWFPSRGESTFPS